MSDLKRFPIKYIRDYIKKDYKTREDCYICSSKTKLELHHLYSVSELFSKWCDKNSIKEVVSVEKIDGLIETYNINRTNNGKNYFANRVLVSDESDI